MSATANEGLPYPTLCPWLRIAVFDYSRRALVTVEHERLAESFEVETRELTQQFAPVFRRALKLKHDMVTAAEVAKALSNG